MNLRRCALLNLLFLLLIAPLAHAQKATAETPAGVAIKREIVYSTVGKRELHVLLARPNPLPKRDLPVVIYLHGGAWRNGSYQTLTEGAWDLAKGGFAVASVEFRSSDDAIYPAPLEDCRAAVGFLKKNANGYSLDATKIGVYGISTGGHLAALLALTSSSVKAAAIESAPSDLLTLNEGARLDWNAPLSPLSRLLGGTPQSKTDLAKRASPLFYADEYAPPFLILHGDADDFVPIAQSEKLYQKLKAAGAPVEFAVFEGEAHGLKTERKNADGKVLNFFQKQFK